MLRPRSKCRRTPLLAVLLLALLPTLALCLESVLSASLEASKDAPRPPLKTPSLHALYPPTTSLLAHLRNATAACPSASLGFAGDLLYVTLTHPAHYAREHILHARTRLLFVFGATARSSFITPAVATAFVDAACAPPHPTTPLATAVAAVLAHAEIVIVPLLSPSARRRAEAGGFCDVANGGGVDVLRNFAADWGAVPAAGRGGDAYAHASTNSTASAGDGAFSEAEAVAVRTIVTAFQPAAFVVVESGYEVGLAPGGVGAECRGEAAAAAAADGDDDARRLKAVSDRVQSGWCWACSQRGVREATGSGRCGSIVDWASSVLKGGFVYSWRVYADDSAGSVECLRAFNPVTRGGVKRVARRWAGAMVALTQAVHEWQVVVRKEGREAAMRNLTEAAARAVREPAETGRADEEEEAEDQVWAGGVGRGRWRRQGGEGGVRNGGGGEGSEFGMMVVAGVACLAAGAGLFTLRKFVFTQRLKRYRTTKRRGGGGGIWRAVSTNIFKVQ